MSDESLKKGNELMQQAESKKGSGGGFLGGLFGSKGKSEEVAELFVRAGNAYKMGKNWTQAGKAFTKAADSYFEKGSKHDAASNYVDAANCYRKVSYGDAEKCLNYAIDIFTDMGRFTIAAKHHMSIGEIYEAEGGDPKKAAENYQKAADYYSGEESNASASKCLGKVAHLLGLAGEYQRAAKIYEDLGKAAMENSLLKYGAKDHFFKACICHMNIDWLNSKQALERYEEQNPTFADSREFKLLVKLIEFSNPDEPNPEEFSNALADYDSISRLDPWVTRLLNNVKKSLKADEPELT